MVLRRTLLITAFADQMSSQLTNLVPVLDGTNYQQWATAMQSFLMSQGQWKCVKRDAVVPTVGTTEELLEEGKVKVVVTGQAEYDAYAEDAEKALGNIRLRLHHTIGSQFNEVDNPAYLWEQLKEKYGSPGISRAFIEFKGAMDTVIPNGSDPSPALDKMAVHFVRLKESNLEVPVKIQCMMLLAKAPLSMESAVQTITTVVMKDPDAIKTLNTEKITTLMQNSWEMHG